MAFDENPLNSCWEISKLNGCLWLQGGVESEPPDSGLVLAAAQPEQNASPSQKRDIKSLI